jgi:hypothetical protein
VSDSCALGKRTQLTGDVPCHSRFLASTGVAMPAESSMYRCNSNGDVRGVSCADGKL